MKSGQSRQQWDQHITQELLKTNQNLNPEIEEFSSDGEKRDPGGLTPEDYEINRKKENLDATQSGIKALEDIQKNRDLTDQETDNLRYLQNKKQEIETSLEKHRKKKKLGEIERDYRKFNDHLNTTESSLNIMKKAAEWLDAPPPKLKKPLMPVLPPQRLLGDLVT